MFCKKCGKINPSGVKFCSGCGASLDDQSTEKSDNNNKKLVWRYILLAGIGLVAVISVVSVIRDNSNDVTTETGIFVPTTTQTLTVTSAVTSNETELRSYSGEHIIEDNPVQEASTATQTPPPVSTPAPTETEEAILENIVDTFGTIEDINRVCAVQATCETDYYACVVDVSENSANAYDVIYDYGEDYQAYVDACDWTLVFDAEYYKTTFPMLALQYHNDDALLLKHFQTVGIHEGRQGSANFNAHAYGYNCSDEIYNAFGRNWAAYYIYYMMNNAAESSVNTVTANNGKTVYQQMTCIYTAVQLMEYDMVNEYRVAANAAEVKMNAELNAFANYRAYLNAHDGYSAHDWAINNDPAVANALVAMGSTNGRYAENTVTQTYSYVQAYYNCYAESPEHYATMISGDYNYVGVSNLYWNGPATRGSQFDVYAYNLNTVI